MPGGIRRGHGKLMFDLSFAIFWKTRAGRMPCFRRFLSSDDSNTDAALDMPDHGVYGFGWRFRIFDGNGTHSIRGPAASFGRAGYHDAGHQLGFQRWMQPEVSDLVELA